MMKNRSLPVFSGNRWRLGSLHALIIFLVLGARCDSVQAQQSAFTGRASDPGGFSPIAGAIYETTFRQDNVEIFAPNGVFVGLVGKVGRATGLAFDVKGNLFVASDDSTAGYSIKKVFATDGRIGTFTTTNLSGPHGIAFDQRGNLYVANNNNNTVVKYTPNGTSSTFANRAQGLVNPIGLAFDASGNLFVTNTHGGSMQTGRVIKLSPDGSPTIVVSGGLATPYGIVFDAAGDFYVSLNGTNEIDKFAPDGTPLGVFCRDALNAPYGMLFDDDGNLLVANNNTATIERFAPDGSYLGVFATTRGGPHFLAIYHPQ